MSEPTAATNHSSETAATAEPLSSAERDATGAETEAAVVAVAAGEPEAAAGEAPAESDVIGEEPLEDEDLAGEELAVREDLTDEERLLAFAGCMRDNGVDFPDPVVEADGTVTFGALREIGRDPDLPAARETCQDLVAGLAFGPGQGGFDLVELQDTLLEFARCMRDNGVDMGDPDLSRIGPGADDDGQAGGPFGVIDLDDPDFAAAFAVCQQRLPGAGDGPSLGGGS